MGWAFGNLTIRLLMVWFNWAMDARVRRWLPWYMRGICSLVFGMSAALGLWADLRVSLWGKLIACVLYLTGCLLMLLRNRIASRNRDEGDDQQQREAQAAGQRLTELQAAALQREARSCA